MSVIATTRFDPDSHQAVLVAAQLARLLGVTLRLVHVMEQDTAFPLTIDAQADALGTTRRARTHKLLEHYAKPHIADGLRVTTTVLQGDVVRALVDEVAKEAPELLVVGGSATHRETSQRGFAEAIAQSVACPVLFMRPTMLALNQALETGRRLKLYAAVDRTRASDSVLRTAGMLRTRLPCDLVVAYTYWPQLERERLGVAVEDVSPGTERRVAQILEDEIRKRFLDAGGSGELSVSAVPHTSSAWEEIVASAQDAKADIVLVGSHRRDALARLIHGSVSHDVLLASDIPVLCVGVQRPAAEKQRPIHSVLAATDFTDSGNAAVAHALRVLDGEGELTVMYVAAQPMDGLQRPWPRTSLLDYESSQLHVRLRGLIPEAIDSDALTVTCVVQDEGPAAEKIMQTAERIGADLIVVGAGKKHVVDRVLIGSVATELVSRSTRPVTIVKMRPS